MEQEKLTPVAALRVIAGEHYTSAQYARDLARGVLRDLSPAAALELGTVAAPASSGLELTELELIVTALAEHTIACRQSAVAKRRNGDNAGADADLQELMRTGVLQNRLAIELTDRVLAARPRTLEESATCSECGGRGGRHEIDCDLRPVSP